MNEKKKIFLSAEWKNLILLNYAVEESILLPYLPNGCELDRYQGKAYVSLVAFQFLNTRVLGIRWPGFTNFPEINLRFYVQYQNRRGVVFIREYVPSRWVASIAKILYNEPYKSAQMFDQVETNRAIYALQDRNSALKIETQLRPNSTLPGKDSLEHFFKEHDLGIGRNRNSETVTYEVSHPHWKIRTVYDYQLQIDWAELYGPEFQCLAGTDPDSVVFAEGSEIQVFFPEEKISGRVIQ